MKNFINYINSKSAEQLRGDLKELYSSFDLVKNYYQIKFKGREIDEKLLTKYKTKIRKALYPNARMEGGLDIKKIDIIIKELKSNTTIRYYIETCLYAIQECTAIANEFGGDFGEDFYIYFEELFENTLKIITHQRLEQEYESKLKIITNSAYNGYGHYDQLQDTLSKYFKDFRN